MVIYIHKEQQGGEKMGKDKKPKKNSINYRELAIQVVTELIVGIILIIIEKLFN